VGGEHDRGVAAPAQLGQELPHGLLADHVQADRRLVEEQDLRPVQQGGGQLAAHPLAQGELAHGRVEELVEFEHGAALGQAGLVLGGRHPVDVAQQLEGVAQGQVPPERRPLSKHDTDAPGQLEPLRHGFEPAHRDLTGGRRQHAGEHLERGGLAGPVGTQVAHYLPALDGQADAVDGGDGPAGAAKLARLDADGELLAEVTGFDDVHDPVLL